MLEEIAVQKITQTWLQRNSWNPCICWLLSVSAENATCLRFACGLGGCAFNCVVASMPLENTLASRKDFDVFWLYLYSAWCRKTLSREVGSSVSLKNKKEGDAEMLHVKSIFVKSFFSKDFSEKHMFA